MNNYLAKYFDNVMIKTNLSDNETRKISDYPIFAYLIFMFAYYMIFYNNWKMNANIKNKFSYIRIIITSLVSLINVILINASKHRDEYIFNLITSKFFSKIDTIFNNKNLLEKIKEVHKKYLQSKQQVKTIEDKDIDIISIDNLKQDIEPNIITSYRIMVQNFLMKNIQDIL